MPETNYKLNPETLEDLLDEASDGRLQLPDFQRGWVWDDDHIRSLLASISLSYPVGAVMMLEMGASIRFQRRPLEGVSTSVGEADRLILDGQQRLTSLFQSLRLDEPVATEDQRGRKINRWYYIDIWKAVHGEESNREDAILSIPEDRKVRIKNVIEADYSSAELEYQSMVFPLKDIFDPRNWADGFKKYWNDQDKSKLWNDFDRLVGKNFNPYNIPVISLGKNTPPAAVCQVFEKVNQGGVPLTVFELLTATFAVSGFRLREDWEAREEQLKEPPELSVLSKVSSTDFLQAITLLATRERREQESKKGNTRPPRISCRREDILKLTLKEYKKWADPLMDGFKQAAFFLRTQNVLDAEFLPYGSQLIPLAAIRTVLQKSVLTDGEREKMAQWYWCGVFGELYGGSTESRFANDLPDVVNWVSGGEDVPDTMEVARGRFDPNRLLSLRDLRSAAYKGVRSLILRKGAYDWMAGAKMENFDQFGKAVDVHHIFPQKWCKDRKIDKDLYNSIVNKTPLFRSTNQKIGGRAPSEYTSDIQREAGIGEAKLDSHLQSHLIDPDLLRGDSFGEFFKARHRDLVDEIGKAMGQKVNMDMVADYEVYE